jgi:hypothetical protein
LPEQLKRVAIFQVRSMRFRLLNLRMYLSLRTDARLRETCFRQFAAIRLAAIGFEGDRSIDERPLEHVFGGLVDRPLTEAALLE